MTSPDGVRIGCGSGFWGDAFDPAEELLRGGELDYLGFDFLAELTMALLQRLRAKNPDAGFVEDAVQFMADLAAPARERGTVLVSNGGGVNPEAGARAIVARLAAKGLSGIRVGTVAGDDLLPRIDELLAAGIPLANSVTGDTDLERIRSRIVCANAYLGSEGIIAALEDRADIVITGRVADSAVFVGPILHKLGMGYEDPDLVGLGAEQKPVVRRIAESLKGETDVAKLKDTAAKMEAQAATGDPKKQQLQKLILKKVRQRIAELEKK